MLVYGLLVLMAFVALALRVHDLGGDSLWFDEALEFSRAASLRTALVGRAIDQDPPLFALFIHFWMKLGTSEYWLRLPSALVGVATVLVAGGWAIRRLGVAAGLVLAALLSLAPSLVHYSRELNQYSLLVFLGFAVYLANERLLRRGGRRDWAMYALLSVVGITTHYGLVFPLIALGVYLGVWVKRHGSDADRRRFLIYCALVVVTLALLTMSSLPDQLSVPHLQRRFGGTHLQKELDYVADRFWREVLVFFLFPFAGGPVLWAVTGLAIVAALGSVRIWRRGSAGRRLVGLLLLGSLALVYPADGLGLYPMGHRYILFLAPPFFAALATGLGAMADRSRAAAAVAVAGTLMLFLLFSPLELVPNQWVTVPKEDLRPVLAQLDSLRQPTEAIYVYYGALPAFQYYRPDGSPLVILGEHLQTIGAESEAQRIASAGASSGCWLIVSHDRQGEVRELLDALERRGLVASRWIQAANAMAVRIEGRRRS